MIEDIAGFMTINDYYRIRRQLRYLNYLFNHNLTIYKYA